MKIWTTLYMTWVVVYKRQKTVLPEMNCIDYYSVEKYSVHFQMFWEKRYRQTSKPHKMTRLDSAFSWIFKHRISIHTSVRFRNLSTKSIVKSVIIYTFRQQCARSPGTMSAGRSDRRSTQRKNLTTSKKIKIHAELLKLSKNWAPPQSRYEKLFWRENRRSPPIQHRMEASKRPWKSVDLNFETGRRHLRRRRNINIENGK